MPASDWTPEQIEGAIPLALKEGDMEAVDALLRMLAVRDPRRCEEVIATMELGLEIRKTLGI